MSESRRDGGGELAGLELRMRELLGALDGAQLSSAALERAWNACAEYADEIEELARSVKSAPQSQREVLRKRIAHIVELNAIALSTAERERDRASTEIERVDGARERLRELGTPDE